MLTAIAEQIHSPDPLSAVRTRSSLAVPHFETISVEMVIALRLDLSPLFVANDACLPQAWVLIPLVSVGKIDLGSAGRIDLGFKTAYLFFVEDEY